MISMSYRCTNTSCSKACPGRHLILVSANYHAMYTCNVTCCSSYYACIEDVLHSTFLLQDGFTGRAHVTLVTQLLWSADLIGYHLSNQVTLSLNHVKKIVAVPFTHLHTSVKTCMMLASGAVPGACQVDKLEVRCL